MIVRAFQLFIKHVIDRLAALILIIACSPIFLATAIFILLSDGRPVFFKQKRPGLNGKPFNLLKFKTMKNLYDRQGEPLPDNRRMTRGGTWLRRLSLDELPQFINVLKGDMSFIGPRPLLMEYLPLYNDRQKIRMEIKPGITGLAQVNGRNAITWEERFEFDVWYVQHYSLFLDLKILFLTALKVFKREGISQEGHVTMEKFRGTHHEHQ